MAGDFTRREFLVVAGVSAAGLCLELKASAAPPAGKQFSDPKLAAYLDITEYDDIRIVTPELEFGQGVYTSLPLILADELGANFERVTVAQSWADERFINPLKGIQATGRSMSVRGLYEPLRRLGATARMLLCEAAAQRWAVPAAECTTQSGDVVHVASGRRLGFGSLVQAAKGLPMPVVVTLRPDSELRLIGRDQRRKDVPAKVTGAAEFGVDVRLPGMLVATVAAAPVFGAKLVSLDDAKARAMPGVKTVVRLEDGVAVVAENFWQAKSALAALDAKYESGPNDAVTSDALQKARIAALDEPGIVAVERGDVDRASGKLTFDYEVPYLAHATMEPMNCTALVTADACRIWAPSQGPIRLRDAVAEVLGMPKEKVSVQRTFAGGGFGRRWQIDYGLQAVRVAREVPGRPVKLIWTREEDLRHDFYRPAFAMRAHAALDGKRRLAALDVKLAGASISEWGNPGRLKGKPDVLAVSTFADSAYAIDNYRVRWVATPGHVPVGVWRSVGQSHNGFFMECLMDELAAKAGRDPLAFRLELLTDHPRLRTVLETAAKRAGWGRKLPKGEGLGLALVEDQGSAVAQVAHVRMQNGKLRVLEVSCAIDCGKAVQPEVIRMQMEGGIIFGLSALYHGEVHIANGAARESNFHEYRVLSLADAPKIGVDVIEGGLPLGGVGEPGVPPVAPAVVNAIFAATGKRIRSLPLVKHGLV